VLKSAIVPKDDVEKERKVERGWSEIWCFRQTICGGVTCVAKIRADVVQERGEVTYLESRRSRDISNNPIKSNIPFRQPFLPQTKLGNKNRNSPVVHVL
jgi:hypothetical protein